MNYHNAKDISSLFDTKSYNHRILETNSEYQNLFILSNEDSTLGATSDFYKIRPQTLLQWQQRLAATDFKNSSSDFDMNLKEDPRLSRWPACLKEEIRSTLLEASDGM